MERPAKQLGSRHLMVKPSPRTFYVHKQKSLEQLRRISSNSLAGCCVARTKPSPRPPGSLHVPLLRELRTVSAGIAGEGWRLLGSCGGVHSPSAPSPIATETLRQATECTNSSWIRPASLDISPDSERSDHWKEAREPRCPGLLPTVQSCPGKMAQQAASPDTLAVPEVDNPHCANPWLNEDLVKSLRENLLQNEKSKTARKSVSPKLSPVISPRNSPRLLRRMLLNSNIPKQRRFTVAHTW